MRKVFISPDGKMKMYSDGEVLDYMKQNYYSEAQ